MSRLNELEDFAKSMSLDSEQSYTLLRKYIECNPTAKDTKKWLVSQTELAVRKYLDILKTEKANSKPLVRSNRGDIDPKAIVPLPGQENLPFYSPPPPPDPVTVDAKPHNPDDGDAQEIKVNSGNGGTKSYSLRQPDKVYVPLPSDNEWPPIEPRKSGRGSAEWKRSVAETAAEIKDYTDKL